MAKDTNPNVPHFIPATDFCSLFHQRIFCLYLHRCYWIRAKMSWEFRFLKVIRLSECTGVFGKCGLSWVHVSIASWNSRGGSKISLNAGLCTCVSPLTDTEMHRGIERKRKIALLTCYSVQPLSSQCVKMYAWMTVYHLGQLTECTVSNPLKKIAVCKNLLFVWIK